MKNLSQNIPVLIGTLFLFFIGTSSAQVALQEVKTEPFTIGKTITLHSEILKEDRVLNIYLPQGYESSKKKYPVIYLLDGSAHEDFIHIAGLVQFQSFSWLNMLPETIVVGIANIDRKKDFTYPSNNDLDNKELPTSGGSGKFIQFIANELQPYMASNFKISEIKTIIGQSLGGLLASEILLKKPDIFDNYLIVSPSTWWDDESLLKLTPAVTTKPKNIFVAVGTEGPLMQTGATKLYYNVLKAHKKTSTVTFKFLEKQDHGDTLHLAAYMGLELFFKK